MVYAGVVGPSWRGGRPGRPGRGGRPLGLRHRPGGVDAARRSTRHVLGGHRPERDDRPDIGYALRRTGRAAASSSAAARRGTSRPRCRLVALAMRRSSAAASASGRARRGERPVARPSTGRPGGDHGRTGCSRRVYAVFALAAGARSLAPAHHQARRGTAGRPAVLRRRGRLPGGHARAAPLDAAGPPGRRARRAPWSSSAVTRRVGTPVAGRRPTSSPDQTVWSDFGLGLRLRARSCSPSSGCSGCAATARAATATADAAGARSEGRSRVWGLGRPPWQRPRTRLHAAGNPPTILRPPRGCPEPRNSVSGPWAGNIGH